MANDFRVPGRATAALFSLTIHRGEGMCLLAMNWKEGEPPADFVGFAIEFRPPDSDRFFPVKNRICFPGKEIKQLPGQPTPKYPTTEAPLQAFRWVHFPHNANLPGSFTYRVTPVFMNNHDELSRGVPQLAQITLASETHEGMINVCFTRGYVSSQAFVDQFGGAAAFPQLIAPDADSGPTFVPTHPRSAEAYSWMGFEARAQILKLLDEALADGAEVSIVAYELNLPELIDRLGKFGARLRIILDDSKNKGSPSAAESQAAVILATKGMQVKRQHMGGLQHNKMIVVDGPNVQRVVCGSTNFSWRGFYVQANNAVLMNGPDVVAMQLEAFDAYWNNADGFTTSPVAQWRSLPYAGIDGQIAMSPHGSAHLVQNAIGADIKSTTSSLLYSLAFLNITPGIIKQSITTVTNEPDKFVYGISDQTTKLVVDPLSSNPKTVSAASLTKNVPEPFKSEATGGAGVKMHHKFVVIDFDKPTARVYTGSFNFSKAADQDNGENLMLFKDQKIATAYMVEAVRIFDSYSFRVAQKEAKKSKERIALKKPPRLAGEVAWWRKFYDVPNNPNKARDRLLFS
jgi:PLD-like domain